MMTTEMERINMMVRQKNGDIEKWKNRFNELEQSYLEKDRVINQLRNEITRLQTIIDELNAEIRILKTKIINPAEYENKILILQ